MTENKKFQERINYIKDTSTGKEVLIGAIINYPGVFEGDDIEDLKRVAKSFIESHIQFTTEEVLDQDEPFDLREMTLEEFEAKDDNITYWEIERLRRILKRPEVYDKWKDIIADKILLTRENHESGCNQIAAEIMEALVSYPNE